MTNKKRIIEELLQLSDEDFAKCIEDIICPTCSDCPRLLYKSCQEDIENNFNEKPCFIHIQEWLRRPYEEIGNLISPHY